MNLMAASSAPSHPCLASVVQEKKEIQSPSYSDSEFELEEDEDDCEYLMRGGQGASDGWACR